DVWIASAHFRNSARRREVRTLPADDEGRCPDPLDYRPQVHHPGRIRSDPCLADALGVITPDDASVGVLTQTLYHPLLDGGVAQRWPQRPPVLTSLGPG